MRIVHEVARFKIHLNRVWSIINIPVQLFQVFLLIYVAIKQNGNPVFWLVFPLLGVLTVVIWWLDDKKLLSAETEYSIEKTPSWQKLFDDIKEIKQKLDEREYTGD